MEGPNTDEAGVEEITDGNFPGALENGERVEEVEGAYEREVVKDFPPDESGGLNPILET